jgi:hypothetical protein
MPVDLLAVVLINRLGLFGVYELSDVFTLSNFIPSVTVLRRATNGFATGGQR